MNLDQPEADIFAENPNFVYHFVNRMRRKPWYRRVSRADLAQAGYMGMLRGIRTYPGPSSGVKPTTWVGNHIHWEIWRQYGSGSQYARDPCEAAWPMLEAIDESDALEEIDDADEALAIGRAVRRALEELRGFPSGPSRPNWGRMVDAVCRYHGIGCAEQTLAEIASVYGGLSRERVRQIVENGHQMLRLTPAMEPYRRADWQAMQERRAADQERLARVKLRSADGLARIGNPPGNLTPGTQQRDTQDAASIGGASLADPLQIG